MEHGGDTDPRAQMLWVSSDSHHGLGGCLEQQIIDQRLVSKSDGGDLGRKSEHDMEVAHRQQIGFARLQPCACGGPLALGAMPVAAGVVGDPPIPAISAGFDVPPKGWCAAMLNRRHDLELLQA